jgi:hypothetical protein
MTWAAETTHPLTENGLQAALLILKKTAVTLGLVVVEDRRVQHLVVGVQDLFELMLVEEPLVNLEEDKTVKHGVVQLGLAEGEGVPGGALLKLGQVLVW